MKDRHHNNKIFRDCIARGREMQREADAAEIAQMKAALDKALAENLALREQLKPTHLDAVARQGSHADIAR